jgi:putative oxidoreductase
MKRVLFDIAALISRVAIGIIFLAHGLQKWQGGLGGTTAMMTQMGVPQPQLAAGFTATAETVGGAFLILGLLVRLAALALLVGTIGAMVFVHAANGIFIADNGWELVGALAAACLLFLALGGGRIGVDGIFAGAFRHRRARRAAEREAARAPIEVPQESVRNDAGATSSEAWTPDRGSAGAAAREESGREVAGSAPTGTYGTAATPPAGTPSTATPSTERPSTERLSAATPSAATPSAATPSAATGRAPTRPDDAVGRSGNVRPIPADSSRAASTPGESTRAEPVLGESTRADSTPTESTRAESTRAESTRAESTRPESTRAGSGQAQPGGPVAGGRHERTGLQEGGQPSGSVPDQRKTTGENWSEEDLSEIDALFADDKKRPDQR